MKHFACATSLCLLLGMTWRCYASGEALRQTKRRHRAQAPFDNTTSLIAPRVVMSYETATHMGLCNQLQVMKYAFMLSYILGAEVVLASARKRTSFENFYITHPFEEVPIKTVLNVEHISAHWARLGMVVHEVCYHLRTFFPQCLTVNREMCQSIHWVPTPGLKEPIFVMASSQLLHRIC